MVGLESRQVFLTVRRLELGFRLDLHWLTLLWLCLRGLSCELQRFVTNSQPAHHLHKNFLGVLESLEKRGVRDLELLLLAALQGALLDLLLRVDEGNDA